MDSLEPRVGLGGRDLRLLLVCTANHCRSPLAQHLLLDEVALRDLNWVVTSAGTHVLPGQPMHPSAARLLARRGIDTRDWTSQILTAELVAEADLVLTAGEEHRGAVVRLVPTALSRTFTLLQFAYLSRAVPMVEAIATEAYGRTLVEQVAVARTGVQPMPRMERDLPDPMGQSFAKFRKCATTIERALEQMLVGAPVRRWKMPPGVTG